MRMNLRNRILLPSAAVIVLLVAISGIVSFLMSRSTSQTILTDQMQQICESSLRQVESWVDIQRMAIVQWSVHPEVASALAAKETAGPARRSMDRQLQHAKQLYGFYEDIHLADATGLTMASSNPSSVDKLTVADRQYFIDAMKGNTVVSEVLKSRTTGNPICVIATPVKDGQTIQGVIYGVLDLNWFSSKFIAGVKVLQTGYAFLFDEKGIFIAHPDAKRILQTKLSDFPWGQQVAEMKSGQLSYEFEGIGKEAVFRTSPALGWGFVLTAPTSEINAPAYRMGQTITAVGVAGLIAGIIVVILVARSIARPVHNVAQSLNEGADQVASASGQVSAASQSLAEGSSEQAASLEETSSSLEEMASMTRRNAENAESAKQLANQTRTAAEAGATDMREMSQAMAAIKDSSDNIAKIIKTIDEIAFQTNILALNAAVEAARAGEAGMGFAVVADEVRNLAQRSAQAAKETADKIQDAIQKSEDGVRISGKVARGLEEIVGKARQVDELVAEIAGASREQSQGITQVNTAVTQMDKVTQSNAASAEETASAAEELNAQAAALKDAVGELMKVVQGSSTTSAPTHAAAGRVLDLPQPSVAKRQPSPSFSVRARERMALPEKGLAASPGADTWHDYDQTHGSPTAASLQRQPL